MKCSVVLWLMISVSSVSAESRDIVPFPRDMRMPECGIYKLIPDGNPIVLALELDPETAEWMEIAWEAEMPDFSIGITIDTCPFLPNGVVFEIDGRTLQSGRWEFTDEGVVLAWRDDYEGVVVSLITLDGESGEVLWFVRSDTQYVVYSLRMYASLDVRKPDRFSPRW